VIVPPHGTGLPISARVGKIAQRPTEKCEVGHTLKKVRHMNGGSPVRARLDVEERRAASVLGDLGLH
jgi:hypothetical protein